MTISLEEEQHGEDEMQDVDANVNTLDEEVLDVEIDIDISPNHQSAVLRVVADGERRCISTTLNRL